MEGLLRNFSFSGRANRQRYWLTALAIFGLFFVSALVAGVLSLVPLVGPVVAIVLWLALLTAGVANGARRLHDRGKSAWWLLVFLGVPTIFSIPAAIVKADPSVGAQALGSLIAVLGLPFSIWGFVVMGCLKGTDGPNKYGDDPLQPLREVFA
jgi:uncharacterized membrane protein YhaH (DUF805 family)